MNTSHHIWPLILLADLDERFSFFWRARLVSLSLSREDEEDTCCCHWRAQQLGAEIEPKFAHSVLFLLVALQLAQQYQNIYPCRQVAERKERGRDLHSNGNTHRQNEKLILAQAFGGGESVENLLHSLQLLCVCSSPFATDHYSITFKRLDIADKDLSSP